MANYNVSGSDLTNVADAIRTKGGTSASLSFPDGFVSAVAAIPTGGSSTLITKSITANGTYDAQDDDADGYSSVTVTVPSAGSSNVVIGTFTGSASEKGTAKAITVPYSGSGYPVSLLIYPTAGAYKSGTDIYASLQTKAIVQFLVTKSDVSLTPDYTNNAIQNKGMSMAIYKNSTSDPDQYSISSVGKDTNYCYRYAASQGQSNAAKFYNNATNLTVYIANDGGTEYGFLAGTEYTYVIQYSA